MLADVTQRGRAEDRVGDRVQHAIGIAVADQAGAVGNLHAAQAERAFRSETVEIESGSDAHGRNANLSAVERCGVLLVAAGEGRRLGVPKAGIELDGMAMVERAAAAFQFLDDRVAVLRPSDLDAFELPGWKRVVGGSRRRDSVAAGLDALSPETSIVLVHDAARALVPTDLVRRVINAAETSACVIPVLPVTDTIKCVDGERVVDTPDRAGLVSVQTPQAFSVELLRRALAASIDDATDEATLVEALGEPVVTVRGDRRNFKITTPLDLEIARLLLQP